MTHPLKRKRTDNVHKDDEQENIQEPYSAFTNRLYDELVLAIFSHLDFADLSASSRVCHHWRRLASENLLWQGLYLKMFTRPRLRGLRGHFRRADGRATRPLPGRVDAEDAQDWKSMYRISHNWKKGRCELEEVAYESTSQSHLLLVGSLLIVACSTQSGPVLGIKSPLGNITVSCGPTSCHVTALVQDQSPPEHDQVCFIVFLSTGEFIEYVLEPQQPTTVRRRRVYVPRTPSDRTAPIIQATYHHPLLVTLSQTFHLSIYNLEDGNVQHTQTLTSFTSYPPSSLVLSTPAPGRYKLVMAYAIPVYPNHFSVGSTELMITSYTVSSTRSARAIDVPQGWIDETKYKAMRDQWERKVARVAGCQTDGRWVVLAAEDPKLTSEGGEEGSTAAAAAYRSSSMHSCGVLQLYRLSLSGRPKLTFVRPLYGPTEPISAMTLADGRCVTLGVGGSIWAWDVDTGQGALVAEASKPVSMQGAIAFDERQVVSVHGTGWLSVRRFDV